MAVAAGVKDYCTFAHVGVCLSFVGKCVFLVAWMRLVSDECVRVHR